MRSNIYAPRSNVKLFDGFFSFISYTDLLLLDSASGDTEDLLYLPDYSSLSY